MEIPLKSTLGTWSVSDFWDISLCFNLFLENNVVAIMIAETGLYLVIKFYVFSWNSQFRGFPLLNGLTLSKGVLNQRTGTRRMEDAWRKRWHFARKVSSIENRTLFGKGVIFSNWDGFCSARHFQHGPSFWKSGKSKSTFFAKSRPVKLTCSHMVQNALKT